MSIFLEILKLLVVFLIGVGFGVNNVSLNYKNAYDEGFNDGVRCAKTGNLEE